MKFIFMHYDTIAIIVNEKKNQHTVYPIVNKPIALKLLKN